MKLSESTTRKFIEEFDASDWEIETETGYKPIISSNKTIEYRVYKLLFDNGLELKCADTHIIIDENYNEVYAIDSLNINVRTKFGLSKVISVEDLGYSENMYDLSVDSEEHTYYTNGVLSHNTTTVAAYLVWYSIFNDGKTIAILANKGAAAREVMSRYQMMYEELPKWLQQGVIEWNKGNLTLENKSKVFISATTSSGIRGKSCNFLYIDELSSVSNTVAEDFFASTYPTISSGESSKIVITSTPIGYNHFWRMWDEAERGVNGFIPKIVHYWEHPDHDEQWAKEQKELLGELKFNQEILMHFLGSSLTLVNSDTISRMSPVTPILQKDGLDIIEAPKNDKNYVIIADTAKGVGGDYSAFNIIDITQVPYKQVGKYRNNKISPMLYPNVIYKVAKDYNNAHVLIEINSSEQVPMILYSDLEYENILFVGRGKQGQEVTGGFGSSSSNLGVTTDKKVKRVGCMTLKALLEENKLIVTDADTINEFSTFIEHRGSYSADDGYHDDLVMGLVLFSWLTTNLYFKNLNDTNLRQSMYESHIIQIENELTPFGFYHDGLEDAEKDSKDPIEKGQYTLTEDQIELLNNMY